MSAVALRSSPKDKAPDDPTKRVVETGTSFTTPGKPPEAVSSTEVMSIPLVTPAEGSADLKDKQVRFDAAEEESAGSSSTSPRGLVSRRGGRFASPGQRTQQSSSPKEHAAVEYKTFRSPTKDEVPSLCSTNSGQLGNDAPTDTVSCDAADTTSPLAQHDTLGATESERKEHIAFLKSKSTTPPPEVKVEDYKLSPKGHEEKKEEVKPSPRRNVQTPTADFCWDYGKPPTSSGSFDQSNVLAWLQSPTANGMFSPGGYGSVMNTPARTPGTPTVSTSFFFSDVASLPRAGETSPSKKAASSAKGVTSIICISPLSTKQKSSVTPMNNYKDVFASPREKGGLPLLADSTTPSRKERLQVPRRSSSKDPNLEAVHLAERDLLEDEDLNVLLQLASNTPRNGSQQPVFRSPRRKEAATEGGGDLQAIHLPMIGREDGAKSGSGQENGEELSRPQLGMRASTSAGSKDIFTKPDKKDSSDSDRSGKTSKKTAMYPMHPPYPHPGAEAYYSMPPGMPSGPAGSMRVVMGGPPQSRGKGSPPRSTHGPPHYHEYSRGAVPYPPPPGMYSQYPPPYGSMGGYPYSYPAPPRHMYGQPPPGKSAKKQPVGAKRMPTPIIDKSNPSKKQRKSPGSAKRKNKSPQLTDKVERQKAAATIQAVNAASGGKNDKAAALAAAILRGVTMRPSGKWQAQLYFAGKSRYIGVFDSREKAALAYEIAREKLKAGGSEGGAMTPKTTENLVNAARKAAFEGVNEKGK